MRTAALASVGALVGLSGLASAEDEQRDIDAIVSEMTLDEKVGRTYGSEDGPSGIAGYLRDIERLDVPGMRIADSPAGVVAEDPATNFPHPIAGAATFNPKLIESQGRAIAREAKDADVSMVLGPSMDIHRIPLDSRAGESYGEDPYLAAELATAYAGSMQSEGVIATLKHFIGYNQTRATGNVIDFFSLSEHDVRVSERALREIYLPPFEAGVTDGNAGAVMTAYNRVNGTFSSEHPELLTDLLKDEWGFDGFVISDWGSTHSTAAAEAGLDVEMPAANHFGDSLADAVRAGEIDEATVDEMVRRTLTAQDDTGELTGSRVGSAPARGTDEHFAIAEQVATEGTVLLKNDDGVLPFDEADISTIALVGPSPETFRTTAGGSESVPAIRRRDPVSGLEDVVGDSVDVTAVETDQWELIEADGDGFEYEYYEETDDPVETGADSTINFEGDIGTGVWSGTITAPESGSFGFALTSRADSTLSVDGEIVAENLATLPLDNPMVNAILGDDGGLDAPNTVRVGLDLEEGREYDIRVEAAGSGVVRLEWTPPTALDDAIAAASDADATVVLAQTDTAYGTDRYQYALPSNQNALIERVTSANENVAVVLNTESPVEMPWVDSAPSILQLWYPGQEAGTALAKLLFGHKTPSGKTPVTFGRSLEDYLPGEIDVVPNDARAYPGVDGTVHYDEDVFVGYRHFDEHDVEPLFAFGHGESYATFKYEDLELEAVDGGLEVACTITNESEYDAKEAVQLYVGDREASVDRPPKELAAIDKVAIAAGETERITLRVDSDNLAFYDETTGDWVVEPGVFDVAVGRSSHDIRLEDRFAVDDELSVVTNVDEIDGDKSEGESNGDSDTPSDAETTTEADDDTEDATPGFGVGTGILGVAGGTLAAKRLLSNSSDAKSDELTD